METTVKERIRNNVEVMELIELKHITNNLDNQRIPLNGIEREKKTKIGLYPYVGANNIQGYIDEYIFDEKILCIAEDGGSWGKGEKCAVIMNEKCWVNNHAHVLTAKDNLILEYLMHYFNYADLSLHINGATRGKLTQRTLNSLKIPLPPLPTQQKIAEILDTADQLRQYNKQLIEKYDALTQSLFLDMFGNPVRNEKGWEKMELGEISDMSSGSTPSRTNENNFIGNIPWVKTTEVNGKIINDTLEKISEEALKNSSCRLFPKGSIVIAMYGQGKTRGQIGILGIEAATNQACCVLRPSNKMNFQFLFYTLSILYDDLRSLGRGGNQPNLNLGLLKNYELINPPLSLQTQFAERVQMIATQKQQAQDALDKSEDLFQSLLQRAFKGDLN